MPDTTIREGVWVMPSMPVPTATSMAPAAPPPPRTDAVVVTGRTAQDVTRLLREPTDEDIERVARTLFYDKFPDGSDALWEHLCAGFLRSARAAIAAYRSHEEADRA